MAIAIPLDVAMHLVCWIETTLNDDALSQTERHGRVVGELTTSKSKLTTAAHIRHWVSDGIARSLERHP